MREFLTKGIPTSTEGVISDVDIKTGTIKGYFAVFGNVDSDREMLMPGAFTKTLKDQGSRVRHVWQHDISKPLSRPELNQDSKGLGFISNVSKTSLGKDVVILYDDGVIDEHSFGYAPVKRHKMSDYYELREVKLWEGSSVTLGANELSLGGPAKSFTKEEIVKKMDTVYKALRNGRYESDEIFEMLDVYHQQLKQMVYDLAATTPAVDEQTPEPEPKNESQEQQSIKSFIDFLKIK